MTTPRIARLKPYYAELAKGKRYLWCSCGLSKSQPFCDGAHKGTPFKPVAYVGQADGQEVLFCGCKQSCDQPFCDGAHNNLPGAYREDDPFSTANSTIVPSERTNAARTLLDGRCYVFSTVTAALSTRGNFHYCTVISEALGAHHQSQFFGQLAGGTSPVMTLGDVHGVLFIAHGTGNACISGRDNAVGPGDGLYVRPGEAFSLQTADDGEMQVYISACPAIADLQWLEDMPETFDAHYPVRKVGIDPDARNAMGSRFFQMLVDRSVGSDVATQFIGHIPKSKAEPHRHLYEEALIILAGDGMMWTDTVKTPVTAGDVIFLPAKQVHSLQSTTDTGMDVVGIIYPGDNPSINY